MKDGVIRDRFFKWTGSYGRAIVRFVAVGIPVASILIITLAYLMWWL
jgi:hypothetical protein